MADFNHDGHLDFVGYGGLNNETQVFLSLGETIYSEFTVTSVASA